MGTKAAYKEYLKFYQKYFLNLSFFFQCSEVMKLNPQQAPLYVSTKFKQFLFFSYYSHNVLPTDLLGDAAPFLFAPQKTLLC